MLWAGYLSRRGYYTANIATPTLHMTNNGVYWAFFAPDKRLTVPFRVDLIWFVLQVSSKTLGMPTSNLKLRRLAAVQTHHDFVMKQGLRFELKCLRPRREIVN